MWCLVLVDIWMSVYSVYRFRLFDKYESNIFASTSKYVPTTEQAWDAHKCIDR